ncbi:DUF4835 family protein [Pontibacter sp. E15-1]|uniref:type IX secretion system protein PorD n=1 Tax=Pontibacter sp. E15-1 TaxID=2919918 RepID=UPI001F4FE1CC|nr:DUF4835 family protein [Pontibacter sp. E15-1]MCJ8165830.1 DUF4835 family protein [Pontibacter sp. E15-1]
MAKNVFVLLLLLCTAWVARAQELQCDVVVNSDQVQYTDRQLFADMQNSIYEFMNNRRWSEQPYRPDERIKCRILINLTDMPEIGTFQANVQVVSVRPAYGTAYESTLFSFIDKDWTFRYTTAQPLDFAENNYTSNLSSMLAFYAYMIVGMDNDSFGRLGGAPSFDKARGILNIAASQGAGYPGWKAFDGNRNRYWLIDNLQDPQFIPYREGIYNMHRLGLDRMAENPEEARGTVLTFLESLQRLQRQKPNAAILRAFFDAKADELTNMFKTAAPAQKQQAFTILTQVDPTNNTKYNVLLKR